VSDRARIAAIERAASGSVPARHTRDIGGWLARHTPEIPTKRANSVLAIAHDDAQPLEDKLAAVEEFYAARDMPARYQLSPVSEPGEIRAALTARGYLTEAPTLVQSCALSALAESLPAGMTTAITAVPSETWWETWRAGRRASGRAGPAVGALFTRIETATAFLTLALHGEPTSTAMGVLDGPWLGVFNMATLPSARRRGAGAAALRALAAWALEHGGTDAYLQVDGDNTPAVGLYETVGFTPVYEYVYLTHTST
jgi:ribosomal protein S18 acetylase RimI-like enzyme